MLMSRLIEEIVAEEEAILDDAEGHLFAGAIERIHDQIANRLSNVNAMLSQLSAAADSTPAEVAAADSPLPPDSLVATAAGRMPPPELVDSAAAPLPHTNGDGVSTTELTVPPTDTPNSGFFERFLQEIEADHVETAAALLAPLLNVSLDEALPLARHFHLRNTNSGDAISKSHQLRRKLASGEVNTPLWLLWECFGLQGPQAIQLLQTLRANLHRW